MSGFKAAPVCDEEPVDELAPLLPGYAGLLLLLRVYGAGEPRLVAQAPSLGCRNGSSRAVLEAFYPSLF